MKKLFTVIFLFWMSLTTSFDSNAQCPAYAPVNYFDTTCYKRLPNDLKVGQGRLGHSDLWGTTGARAFDFYIPAGREGWAIAVVHSWQVMRNVLKYNRDAFNWHSYFGTLMKESFGACDPSLNFTGITRCSGAALVNPFTSLDNYYINTPAGSVARSDGCFQIDKNTGWPVFPLYYPHRWFNATQHTTYMAEANFETATLAKMHYELAYVRMMEYVKGYPFESVLNNTPDNSGGTALVAMSYNKGYSGTPENIFSTPANIAAAEASNDWLTLAFDVPDLNYDYTRAVTHVTRVLSNNYEGGWTRAWSGTGWTSTADNQWHCWFDRQITWAMMTSYMNKFFPLYPEVTPGTVTAKVKAKFDAINGGGSISFRYQLSTVLDEFILNMPYDDPMQGWMYSTAGNSGCHKGASPCIEPDVTLKAKSTTTFCAGLSVDLETVVGTGYTYQWYRNGTLIANSNARPNVFTAKLSGVYSVKVTTSTGCTIESECQITVTTINCSSCGMTATATSTNSSCTGVPNGSVTVALTGAPGAVTYNWTGPVSGNTASMSNVPDGVYTVEVVQVGVPTCKAYATVTVVPTKTVYQKLNLSQTIIDCSTSDLAANVVNDPPASCAYRLKVVYQCAGAGCCYGSWDNSQLRIIAYANGANLGVPSPRTNGSGNCDHLDETITVPHGAAIKITLDRVAGSAVTGGAWQIQLINPSGTTVATHNMSGVSYSSVLTDVINVTSNCNVTLPTYTMLWSPTTELTSISYTPANNASARAIVTTDRTYTITAQHPIEATCAMAKSILVDNTCPPGLPVDWLIFEAFMEGSVTHLNWATSSETNSAVFYVERSRDGVHFETIGHVPAKGNSTNIQQYFFLDGTPHYGTNYYRIRQTDIDGSYQYSEVKMISFSAYHSFRVYPNPSHNHFYIEGGGLEENQKLYVELQDMTGKVVLSKNILVKNADPHLFNDPLPAGIYILKIHDEVSEYTFKLVKQ